MVKPITRWVDKYEARATVAKEDYVYGVRNPKRPPASTAIANRATLEAKMAMKSTWDKWQDSLNFVGDAGVMEAAATKGGDRYVPGVRASIDKVRAFAADFRTHLETAQATVLAMPNVTLADKIARATKMIELNAGYRYKK